MPDQADSPTDSRLARRQRGIFLALAVLLAVAAWFALHSRHAGTQIPAQRAIDPVDAPRPVTPITRTSDDASPRASSSARRSIPVALRSLEGVTRLSQLARLAHAIGASADAQWDYAQAAMACDSARIALRYKTQKERLGQLTARDRASLAARRDFGQRFCDVETEPYSNLMTQVLMEADASEDLVLAFGLQAAEGEAEDPANLPVAERLLLSDSPWAMTRAGEYLLFQGTDLPQARTMPRPAFFDDGQARFDAQLLALRMVHCRMSGGCGPGGLLALYYCVGGCALGRSLAQTWPDSYSAAQIAFARALAERMWRERNAAGQ